MPWNLALWWQLRRLRLAVEMDCDNRVVAALGDPNPYGCFLQSQRPGVAARVSSRHFSEGQDARAAINCAPSSRATPQSSKILFLVCLYSSFSSSCRFRTLCMSELTLTCNDS